MVEPSTLISPAFPQEVLSVDSEHPVPSHEITCFVVDPEFKK